MHLVNGTGSGLSPGQPTPGVVKQDKSSGGSVDRTKTRSDTQRMSSGERPIGTAKGKQSDTEALCQTPSHFRGPSLQLSHPHPSLNRPPQRHLSQAGTASDPFCQTPPTAFLTAPGPLSFPPPLGVSVSDTVCVLRLNQVWHRE